VRCRRRYASYTRRRIIFAVESHSGSGPDRFIPAMVGDGVVRREADHRIANSLQLLSALLSSQGRELQDPKARDAIETSVRRIAAVAGVHRQLHLST